MERKESAEEAKRRAYLQSQALYRSLIAEIQAKMAAEEEKYEETKEQKRPERYVPRIPRKVGVRAPPTIAELQDRAFDDYQEEIDIVEYFDVEEEYAYNNTVAAFTYEQNADDIWDYRSVSAYVQRLRDQIEESMGTFVDTYNPTSTRFMMFPAIYIRFIDSENQTRTTVFNTRATPVEIANFTDLNNYIRTIATELEDNALDYGSHEKSGYVLDKIEKLVINAAVSDGFYHNKFIRAANHNSGGALMCLPDELAKHSPKYIYNPTSSINVGNCAYKCLQKALKYEEGSDEHELLKEMCRPNITFKELRDVELAIGVPIMIYIHNSKRTHKYSGEEVETKSNALLLYSASRLDSVSSHPSVPVINLLFLIPDAEGVMEHNPSGRVSDVAVTGHFCLIKKLKPVWNTKRKLCHLCSKVFNGAMCKQEFARHQEDTKCWLKANPFEVKIKMVTDDECARIAYGKKSGTTRNFVKTSKPGITYYADFECILRKVNKKRSATSKVRTIQEHIPCGMCIMRISTIPGIGNDIWYFREGSSEYEQSKTIAKFWKIIAADEYLMQTKIAELNAPTNTAVDCLIDDLGADVCNLFREYQPPTYDTKFPIFFHNLKNYDSHPLLKDLGKYRGLPKTTVIAQTPEKYLSFTSGSLKFLDSKAFLPFSLADMVKDISKKALEKNDITELRRLFPHTIFALEVFLTKLHKKGTMISITDEQLVLLLKKGIYPYDYMDSFDRFFEDKLPSIDMFNSVLSGREISKKDYEQAQLVWKTFGIRNMGEYHDLYNVQDVGLLADSFEMFRSFMVRMHDVDPVEQFTTPGFSWDAMLKDTGSDFYCFRKDQEDMHEWVEEGIRGGVSIVPGRELIANHKYLKDYDSGIESRFLAYVDAVNLYGWAMTQLLPVGNYKWVKKGSNIEKILAKVKKRDYGKLDDKYYDNYDGKETPHIANKDRCKGDLLRKYPKGYSFEIDAYFPASTHDYLWDYPPCPRKGKVSESKLSHFSRKRLRKIDAKNSTSKKLLLTLEPLKNYVLHERNLQLYLSLGLVITKIHKVMKFDQAPAMRDYIVKNAQERDKQDNEFIKTLLKLLNNSVFGKTMENKRKRINHKFTTNSAEFQKQLHDPYMKNWVMHSSDSIGVNFHKKSVSLDKPIMVGFAILELSKCLMYNFYYNVLKKRYPGVGQLKLGFSDTDSLLVSIQTDDLWKDIAEDKNLQSKLLTRTLPANNPAYMDGPKIPGKMAFQNGMSDIDHFKGLQAKFYAYITKPSVFLSSADWNNEKEDIRKEAKKACVSTVKMCGKGVPSSWLADKGKFDNYLDDTIVAGIMPRIGHVKHDLTTSTCVKNVFNPIDNKFYQINGSQTIPYGHYRIKHQRRAMRNGLKRKEANKVFDRDYVVPIPKDKRKKIKYG